MDEGKPENEIVLTKNSCTKNNLILSYNFILSDSFTENLEKQALEIQF